VVSVAFQPALAQARAALERGRAAEAATVLEQALRSPALTRDDELALRCAMAEACLMRDDVNQASTVLGRLPDALRDSIPPARLSALWRLHGRIAFARGDQSRAIALHGRALKQAELAHDSQAIGLVHYELGLCYRQVGDNAIVREHITKAAPALHAAGDRRHLALLHSLSAVVLAQNGSVEEAIAALRQAERLATSVRANDALGIVINNQANVALIQHRYEQALELAERSVALQEQHGSGRGIAISLATMGQILVRLGQLERAEPLLHRALSIRSPVQLNEIIGAVFDTLAQIALMRGEYELAGEHLRRAGEAYGAYGIQVSQWYEWSIRVLEAKLAVRRGAFDEGLKLAEEIVQSPAAPTSEAIQAGLIACEALLHAGRIDESQRRLSIVREQLEPRDRPGAWGESLRLRAGIHARLGHITEAYHDLAQSASVFDLLGERYQRALSHLALARLATQAGSRLQADQYVHAAASVFEALGAARDLEETRLVATGLETVPAGSSMGSSSEAEDAFVRRLVDAAVLPELLGRETAETLLEALTADASIVYVQPPGADVRVLGWSGCSADEARGLARAAVQNAAPGRGWIVTEPLGRDYDGARAAVVVSSNPLTDSSRRRLRMIASVARQGFELCAARERRGVVPATSHERTLEPLLPGFLCASAIMQRVAEQIQRLQGNDLTVLVTGESGTGKELVARAIHVGSTRASAMFLPFNCTTTTRELADSQLFGHRRGSFTGAVTDQPGLIRTAAGGTLFLDEIGDVPLDVQPKLLRFLEQGEIMPVGETRPQRVDVRVVAATNADLEQRVAEGRFREDLYYRLSVIRIHVPPLRERREEIPHLSSLFLREASERLGKPDVHLGPEALELLVQYWWPGNVRQLRNEIQRAVALGQAGSPIGVEHLSPDLVAADTADDTMPMGTRTRRSRVPTTLAVAVDQLEREMIETALHSHAGNISETAKALGLTRRGLYLKLRRLGFESASRVDTK
jgi:DNA-binding NtrC family response regulator/tetratricopeptide (TPR) repeat protein